MIKITINKRRLLSVTLINLGALSWFFVFNNYLEDFFLGLTPNAPEWGSYMGNSLFYGAIIFWSITISFIGNRINRRTLLFTSIILGVSSTFLLGLVEETFLASMTSFFMGTSLGLGLPSSLALISDCTVFDNRGRVSGLILLSTFFIGFVFMVLTQILNPNIDTTGFTNIWGFITILVVLRSISLIGLIMEKCDNRPIDLAKSRYKTSAYKDFFVYLCIFLLFGIASALAWNLIPDRFQSQVDFGSSIRFILIAVFGVLAGVLADKFGRKQPIMIGLGAIGVGFLMLAFNMNETSVITYMILSGITWGSFFVVFLAIPGDLSYPNSREKFYALGYILPLFGQFIIAAIPAETLGSFGIPENQIALFLGICIFLAIYPLQRLKETLTESKKRERDLKEHLQMVKKIIQETEK